MESTTHTCSKDGCDNSVIQPAKYHEGQKLYCPTCRTTRKPVDQVNPPNEKPKTKYSPKSRGGPPYEKNAKPVSARGGPRDDRSENAGGRVFTMGEDIDMLAKIHKRNPKAIKVFLSTLDDSV